MIGTQRATSTIVLVSGLAVMLSACPNSSSELRTVTTVHVPERAIANTRFTVDVALASDTTAGTASSGAVRHVKAVDTNPPGGAIDCGDQQPVYVDGDMVQLNCTAPDATPSSDNVHTLAISVSESSDPPTNALVEIVNDGAVADSLTDGKGAAVTQAGAAQTLSLAFNPASDPGAVGTYTVKAPTGWTIDGAASCTLPTSSGAACTVSLVTPKAPLFGVTQYVQIERSSGSSTLQRSYFPVQMVLKDSKLTLQYSENIAQTIYANLPGQTTRFTYNIRYTFRNTSGSAQTVADVKALVPVQPAKAQTLTDLRYECDGTATTSLPCTVQDKGYFVASVTLTPQLDAGTSPKISSREMAVSVQVLDSSNAPLAIQSDKSYLADYKEGYAALRIMDPASDALMVAAINKANMIEFDKDGVGTIAATSGLSFSADSDTALPDGKVLYIPYGESSKVYIAHSKNAFPGTAAPAMWGSPTPPPYVVVEPSYQYQLGTQKEDDCNWLSRPYSAANPCDNLTLDLSYVNALAILAQINSIGNAGTPSYKNSKVTVNTQQVTFGSVTSLSTQQVFANASKELKAAGADWAGLAIPETTAAGSPVKWILAPISVNSIPNPSVNPFYPASGSGEHYYADYVDAIWAAYGGSSTTNANQHKYVMRIDASGVGVIDSQGKPVIATVPTDLSRHCIVEGSVNPATGELEFHAQAGNTNCPAKGYVTGGLAGWSPGDQCATSGGGTELCYDTPDITFEKFNDCDLFQAAGSSMCHGDPVTENNFYKNKGLWGPNGTYRAVIGRAIAAYQAAGLLPPASYSSSASTTLTCDPDQIMYSANAAAVVKQELAIDGALSSSPCLSGLSKPTYNVYASAFLPYVDVYTYSYSDFLGRDGTFTFSALAYNSQYTSTTPPLPRAQPVTVILQ